VLGHQWRSRLAAETGGSSLLSFTRHSMPAGHNHHTATHDRDDSAALHSISTPAPSSPLLPTAKHPLHHAQGGQQQQQQQQQACDYSAASSSPLAPLPGTTAVLLPPQPSLADWPATAPPFSHFDHAPNAHAALQGDTLHAAPVNGGAMEGSSGEWNHGEEAEADRGLRHGGGTAPATQPCTSPSHPGMHPPAHSSSTPTSFLTSWGGMGVHKLPDMDTAAAAELQGQALSIEWGAHVASGTGRSSGAAAAAHPAMGSAVVPAPLTDDALRMHQQGPAAQGGCGVGCVKRAENCWCY
jgi:hypothetical protein